MVVLLSLFLKDLGAPLDMVGGDTAHHHIKGGRDDHYCTVVSLCQAAIAIHGPQDTRCGLALTEEFHGRLVLHFLPPYSPKHNCIERQWRELHANVTRNHRCQTLPELLRRVAAFLRRVSPYPGTNVSLMRAPKRKAA